MSANTIRQKPVTMDEIAQLAGVHSRTVADALKGTGRVASATREKVLRIARELNYVPNATARALATGRTGTIAVLSGPLNEPYYANIVHALETHLRAKHYEMTLLHTGREFNDLVQAAQRSLVDGAIVIGSAHLTEGFLRQISGLIHPCVLIDTFSPDFVDHIMLDLRPAVEEALQLMLQMGRRRIAYFANDQDRYSSSEVRMKTYLHVMSAASHPAEVISVDTTMRPQERIQALKAYIEENGCPDAILCQNDETAIYTHRAIAETGYRIPEDVALVGCDGLPYMEFFAPPLSTIALPTEEICVTATRFLQQRMANRDISLQKAAIPGELIVRKSLML